MIPTFSMYDKLQKKSKEHKRTIYIIRTIAFVFERKFNAESSLLTPQHTSKTRFRKARSRRFSIIDYLKERQEGKQTGIDVLYRTWQLHEDQNFRLKSIPKKKLANQKHQQKKKIKAYFRNTQHAETEALMNKLPPPGSKVRGATNKSIKKHQQKKRLGTYTSKKKRNQHQHNKHNEQKHLKKSPPKCH